MLSVGIGVLFKITVVSLRTLSRKVFHNLGKTLGSSIQTKVRNGEK